MRSVTHTPTHKQPEIFNVQIKCKIVKFHFIAAACRTRTPCIEQDAQIHTHNVLKIETDY